jgi:hypothetical protein
MSSVSLNPAMGLFNLPDELAAWFNFNPTTLGQCAQINRHWSLWARTSAWVTQYWRSLYASTWHKKLERPFKYIGELISISFWENGDGSP